MHSSQMFKLIVCILGIFVCYFYYGIIQEKITRSKYGPEKTPFTFALSLVCIQCIVNAMFVKILTAFTGKVNDNTPTCFYGTCAFTYLAAMLSSNKALLYVPYPTQVIGKSCKPIPVMILGVLVAKKRYPLRKYLFILLIILGVALFMYNDKSKSTLSTNYGFGWGEILLLFSLTMDGLTGGIQDKVRARYLCNSNSMMYQMNLWSVLFSSIGLWLTGEMFTFPNFVKKYPEILFNLVSFSIASALGQYFIFMTVAEFGPLTCSIATTTRKFFTVLASVIFFQNPLTLRQWIGTVLVFLGLSLDSFYGKIPLKKEKACSETK